MLGVSLPTERDTDLPLRLWSRAVPSGVQDEKSVVAVAEVVVVYVGIDWVGIGVTQEGRVCTGGVHEGTLVVQVLTSKVIDDLMVIPNCKYRC